MEKLFCYEDEEVLDYQEDYIDEEEDEGNGYYQGYDDDDYQSPDSEYEDE